MLQTRLRPNGAGICIGFVVGLSNIKMVSGYQDLPEPSTEKHSINHHTKRSAT